MKEELFKNENKNKNKININVNKKKVICSKSMPLKHAKKIKKLLEEKKLHSHKKLIFKDINNIHKRKTKNGNDIVFESRKSKKYKIKKNKNKNEPPKKAKNKEKKSSSKKRDKIIKDESKLFPSSAGELLSIEHKSKIRNLNINILPIKNLKYKNVNKNINTRFFQENTNDSDLVKIQKKTYKKVKFKEKKEKNNSNKYSINDNLKYRNLSTKELNNLDYSDALRIDKRTFFQYYCSLVKMKQIFLFTFVSNDDYNIFVFKLSLFLMSFSLYMVVDAFFFSMDKMHEIYVKNGEYDLKLQIPQIIYSSLISAAISILVKYLSLSQSNILEMKKEKNMEKLNIKVKELIKCLKIKFALFFVVSFFLLIFFAYYIICFCGIYVNTQLHLIKDTLISFGLSLIYPFGLCLIPGFFRIPALKAKNKDKECLYKFSKIIQTLCA